MPRPCFVAIPLLLGGLAPAQAPAAAATLVREPLDAADARWNGAVVIADGALRGAARFDGRDSRIDVGPCPVSSTQAFTLRCRLRTTHGDFCTPLMARAGDAVGVSLVLGREPGVVSFEAWSWQAVKLRSRRRVDDGSWHTIEVAYEPEPGLAMLLVDGEVQGVADLGTGGSPHATLRLGDNIGAHQPFAGDLDEVELLLGTTRRDELLARRPVLSTGERAKSLRELRDRLQPRATPSLAADAVAAWPARREAVRRHVRETIGLWPEPAREPLDVRVHAEAVRFGVRLQRVSWSGFPGQRATGWLWTPETTPPGRHPAVLCPHGHWPNGAMHAVVQARCGAFARFGWPTLAVDSVHVEDVASGANSLGAMTWHNQRGLDLLLERDDVDPARIACTGASGGAQQTYYLMAIEDRIAAAAPMVMACYWGEILDDTSAHCGCNHVPGLAAFTDVPEMCAVFAPRPVMFGSVTGDWTKHFPRQGLPELRAHWAQQGGPTPRARHADEGHNYDRPMREQVYGFLHDVLLGPAADGAPRTTVAEPEFEPFPLGAMQTLARECAPVTLAPTTTAREWLGRRAKVGSLAELAPGLDLRIERRPLDWRDPVGAAWRRATVTGPDGVAIPLRVAAPPPPGAAWPLVVHPAGMLSAIAGPSSPGIVAMDPRPYGEWATFRSAWQRNGLLLGRGEGYQAAVDVANVAASLPGDAAVHVEGRGEAGVVALLAAHLSSRITVVVTDDLGRNYAEDGNRLPLCPELLRFRDLPELLATLPPSCTHRPSR